MKSKIIYEGEKNISSRKIKARGTCRIRKTPVPKHRLMAVYADQVPNTIRGMNNVDLDVYLSRKEFATGKAKKFNNIDEFFGDLDG